MKTIHKHIILRRATITSRNRIHKKGLTGQLARDVLHLQRYTLDLESAIVLAATKLRRLGWVDLATELLGTLSSREEPKGIFDEDGEQKGDSD